MKKITLSVFAAAFAICSAIAGSVSQTGYFVWSYELQDYLKLSHAPTQEWIDSNCVGADVDCFYTLDETGVIKAVLYFRGM